MHINPERSDRPDYDLLVRQVGASSKVNAT